LSELVGSHPVPAKQIGRCRERVPTVLVAHRVGGQKLGVHPEALHMLIHDESGSLTGRAPPHLPEEHERGTKEQDPAEHSPG